MQQLHIITCINRQQQKFSNRNRVAEQQAVGTNAKFPVKIPVNRTAVAVKLQWRW